MHSGSRGDDADFNSDANDEDTPVSCFQFFKSIPIVSSAMSSSDPRVSSGSSMSENDGYSNWHVKIPERIGLKKWPPKSPRSCPCSPLALNSPTTAVAVALRR